MRILKRAESDKTVGPSTSTAITVASVVIDAMFSKPHPAGWHKPRAAAIPAVGFFAIRHAVPAFAGEKTGKLPAVFRCMQIIRCPRA
jgi:hypothetical protein